MRKSSTPLTNTLMDPIFQSKITQVAGRNDALMPLCIYLCHRYYASLLQHTTNIQSKSGRVLTGAQHDTAIDIARLPSIDGQYQSCAIQLSPIWLQYRSGNAVEYDPRHLPRTLPCGQVCTGLSDASQSSLSVLSIVHLSMMEVPPLLREVRPLFHCKSAHLY